MSEDILEEAPLYQEILRRGMEKGLKKGLEEGRAEGLRQVQQEMLQVWRQLLLDIVQTRFPQEAVLIRLTKGQAAIIEDAEVLRRLVVRVGILRTADEIQHFLLYYDLE